MVLEEGVLAIGAVVEADAAAVEDGATEAAGVAEGAAVDAVAPRQWRERVPSKTFLAPKRRLTTPIKKIIISLFVESVCRLYLSVTHC